MHIMTMFETYILNRNRKRGREIWIEMYTQKKKERMVGCKGRKKERKRERERE